MASSLFLFVVVVLAVQFMSPHALRVGFYSETCPNAEAIVSQVVNRAATDNPRLPPILLRLHFHDCFVEGCDGSILLTKGIDQPEQKAVGHQGVQGFVEIASAKQALESVCPGIVSCADIVAMAARDAIALAGGPVYAVETGRKDGMVSNSLLAADMPESQDSVDVLKSKFFRKGLSEAELVILSGGAHTIGTAACFFVTDRLYTFGGGVNASDPAISPDLLPSLQSQCPRGGDILARTSLDQVTSTVFDVQSLRNIRSGFSVLPSDAILYSDRVTRSVVDTYAVNDSTFARDFAVAMVKMGRIGVKTGDSGEIRRVCDAANQGQLIITPGASMKLKPPLVVAWWLMYAVVLGII
ncbi:hypothetical protein ABFX02_03G092300 [Erythranthe guttata]